MFNSISGILTCKGSDYLYVDCNDIEWELFVPSRSVDLFGKLGERVRVLTWLLHREDSMKLFGFVSDTERRIFLELITVDGIGPKQAMKILGGIGPNDLEAALDTEDLSRLEAVPGLGKKTAQKLVFALKGKLPRSVNASDTAVSAEAHDDLLRALTELGYDRRRAAEVLVKLDAMPDIKLLQTQDRERELLRKAIVELSVS
ncbi:MAG: Holliday junction branch migration protein RuvA [Spirochaetes bacterium]|nr:Holliday junction branch migration protein RuvA [Spirochaetota bacterium]MBU0953824.1 Holliday junction branch migration protein RuvA [Spirochaetota bacterium]